MVNPIKLTPYTLLVICFFNSPGHGQLVEIYDSGRHLPIPNPYKSIQKNRPTAEQVETHIPLPNKDKNMAMYRNMFEGLFPITTTMEQRVLDQSIKHNKPRVKPIFIVADTVFCREWLDRNQDKLMKIGAIGFVTQVENLDKYLDIRNAYSRLKLLPVSADFVASEFHIDTYPILITAEGISQ